MQVWNLLQAACWKHRTQKSPKIRHLRTIAQLYRAVSLQLRHVSTIGKKLVKQQHLLHMSPQYGKLWPTKGWDRFRSFGHPSEFQRVWRLALVTAATSVTGGQPNFARCLAVWYTIYTLLVALAPMEFCPVLNSLYVQVLRSPILAASLHGTPAAGVSQTLQCGSRIRFSELLHRVPPIFG